MPLCRFGPTPSRACSFTWFLDHTQRRITFGRTPLDEWSVNCRDLYLTTHKTHSKKIACPLRDFFCKMIHLLSSDLEIQAYMIKMHLACQNYHKKGTFSSYCMSWCVWIMYSLQDRGQVFTHRRCTIDCKLNCDYSFSVGLVMPRRGCRWLPGEVTPTCDAPGACGSSAMREDLEG